MKFKNGKKLIRRYCGDGCGGITNYGKKYIHGHNKNSEEARKNMSLRLMGNIYGRSNKEKIHTEEARKNMSKGQMGNANGSGPRSNKHKLNIALGHIKPRPNYQYGCEWLDRQYKKDIRKDYCENINCKKQSKRLCNHHIFLDKKRCAPDEVMTFCNSCHILLHRLLQNGKKIPARPKDYIIINRPNHISYIRKSIRKIIRINKVIL